MASTSVYVKDQTVTKYLSSFRNNDINGIQASLKEESIYRHKFALKPENINSSQLKLLRQPYLNLINVYDNIDIWKIKNRFFNNEAGNNDDDDGMYIMPLPEKKRLKHGDPAICIGGKEKFQKNWRLFTECTKDLFYFIYLLIFFFFLKKNDIYKIDSKIC
jgi:hypothetical protein